MYGQPSNPNGNQYNYGGSSVPPPPPPPANPPPGYDAYQRPLPGNHGQEPYGAQPQGMQHPPPPQQQPAPKKDVLDDFFDDFFGDSKQQKPSGNPPQQHQQQPSQQPAPPYNGGQQQQYPPQQPSQQPAPAYNGGQQQQYPPQQPSQQPAPAYNGGQQQQYPPQQPSSSLGVNGSQQLHMYPPQQAPQATSSANNYPQSNQQQLPSQYHQAPSQVSPPPQSGTMGQQAPQYQPTGSVVQHSSPAPFQGVVHSQSPPVQGSVVVNGGASQYPSHNQVSNATPQYPVQGSVVPAQPHQQQMMGVPPQQYTQAYAPYEYQAPAQQPVVGYTNQPPTQHQASQYPYHAPPPATASNQPMHVTANPYTNNVAPQQHQPPQPSHQARPSLLSTGVDDDRARLEEITRLRQELEREQEREREKKQEKDTWVCLECTYRNKLVVTECEMCGTLKPGAQKAPKRSAISNPTREESSPAKTVSFSSGPWMCSTCAFHNADNLNACKICNTKRRPQDLVNTNGTDYGRQRAGAANNNHSPSDPGQPAVPASDEYSCPTCTLFNKRAKKGCDACGTTNPYYVAHSHPPPPTSTPHNVQMGRTHPTTPPPTAQSKWPCLVCTFENWATHRKCEMCQAPNPNPASAGAPPVPSTAHIPPHLRGQLARGTQPPAVAPDDDEDEDDVAWQDDKVVTNCNRCNAQFGFMLRRHHCRACGFVFCYYCCNNKVELKPGGTKQRVCIDCFRERLK